jgi:hypothetical protein
VLACGSNDIGDSFQRSNFHDSLTAKVDPRTKRCGIFRAARQLLCAEKLRFSRREYTAASIAIVTLGRFSAREQALKPDVTTTSGFFYWFDVRVQRQLQFNRRVGS